jgi:hypothetical protein
MEDVKPSDPQVATAIPAKKKNYGCGCCLLGCFALMILSVSPFIAGFFFIRSLDATDYGHYALLVATNPELTGTIREQIKTNSSIDAKERDELLRAYDAFLNNYEKLSPEKKIAIEKNLGLLFQKGFKDPKSLDGEIPKELQNIFTILGITNLSQIPGASTTDTGSSGATTPGDSQNQVAPTEDAYKFELPPTQVPPVATPPGGDVGPTQYDF